MVQCKALTGLAVKGLNFLYHTRTLLTSAGTYSIEQLLSPRWSVGVYGRAKDDRQVVMGVSD